MNKEIKLAYIAGVLDGDGSFSLIKGTSKTSISPLYYPMIQLANINKALIELFVEEFRGRINTRASYVKNGSHRQVSYQWKIEKAPQSLPILDELIPYLIIKKERASFLREYILNNPFKRGSNKLDDLVLYKREKDYIKMKSFNNRPDVNGVILAKNKQQDANDEIFWSYIAGIMDTDGSFSLKREIRLTGGSKSPVFTPTILLTMTDCRTIYHIINNFVGGNLCVVKAKTATQGFCYRFSITSKKIAIKFLKKCIPFLLIKKDIAEKLLLFCETTQNMNGKLGVSSEQLLFREQYYNEIKKMNGVVKSSLMDLKPLPGSAGGNKAEGNSHRERSKREDHEGGCGTLDSIEI